MPYISFKTNHKLTLRQENTIKSKSGELAYVIQIFRTSYRKSFDDSYGR